MKRKILYLLFIFFLALGYSQNLSVEESEMSLYAGMTSAYKSSSYPAVVEYSVRLEKQFPHSEFLTEASLFRGECYFYLGQYFFHRIYRRPYCNKTHPAGQRVLLFPNC